MADEFPYHLSEHASVAVRERRISLRWVKRVLEAPDRTVSDDADPELLHALGKVPEQGDRVLRVVYNHKVTPWKIVTAYFDRAMKGGV
ncbi:MAG: DUF4258 domain-containing protein [Planctomycetes bacterium]|nr:DUF4258 domain-containing protein [Planctomycetota bacterium]